jgi:hypothetical protein
VQIKIPLSVGDDQTSGQPVAAMEPCGYYITQRVGVLVELGEEVGGVGVESVQRGGVRWR